jgi:hypothetical protein
MKKSRVDKEQREGMSSAESTPVWIPFEVPFGAIPLKANAFAE